MAWFTAGFGGPTRCSAIAVAFACAVAAWGARAPAAHAAPPPDQAPAAGDSPAAPPTDGPSTKRPGSPGDGVTEGPRDPRTEVGASTSAADPGPLELIGATDELERLDDGSYRYRDSAGRFSATVTPQGAVHFADAWRRPDADRVERGRCCTIRGQGVVGPFVPMAFEGPIEWVLRAHGVDPARSAKAAFLRETFELRVALAVTSAKQHIDQRLQTLEFELLDLWADGSVPPESRRALLFLRWDECDERFGSVGEPAVEEARSQIDEYRVQAADRARAKIEAFVRRHLPRGTPKGFGRAELERLNKSRKSRATFSPYG